MHVDFSKAIPAANISLLGSREHILKKAMELVNAGWNGLDKDAFKTVAEDPQFLQGYSITFAESDFPEIQQAVSHYLVQRTPDHSYEHVFEELRRHLLNLANPYAVAYLLNKLEEYLSRPFDPSNEKGMAAPFEDLNLPFETRELFKRWVKTLVMLTRDKRDPTVMSRLITGKLSELKGVRAQLQENNLKVLEEFEGWRDLALLFKLPGFLALSNADYKKLMNYIHQGSVDQLRDFVDDLFEKKYLNKGAIEEALRTQSYEDDFDTLLGEVMQQKPKKKEGIVTYWNHPTAFFLGKTVLFREPKGDCFSGIVEGCERVNDCLIFQLHDKSELHVSSSFEVVYEKINITRKFWTAIRSGSFAEGDVVTIQHSCETDNIGALPPGKYSLSGPKNKRRTKSQNGFFATIDYVEFSLINVISGINYLLQGDYNKQGEIHQISLCRTDQSKQYMSIFSFERIHSASKKERLHLATINKENADQLVLFKEEPDEDKIRLLQLQNIKKQIDDVRAELLNDTHRDLLKALIQNLVRNQLKYIDFELLPKDSDLAKEIKAISQKYYDQLKIERSPSHILFQLVLEANYAIHVNKKDNILIARTMELLKDAYIHIEKMRGKEIVLFVGNTGSGKSTAISYYMGAKITEFTNPAGEKALRLDRDMPPQNYPRIGQSIGTSETLYTQGFEVPNADYLLADSPGFNDTRGGDYELCTALSIDQAVGQAKNIRSLVLVIQASEIVTSRGNNLIELINIVKERFPDTFKPNTPVSNPPVYLLVTKTNQLQGDTVAKLKDGSRIDQIVVETQKQMNDLLAQGSEADSFEVQSLQRRLDIWKAIQMLQKTDRMHLMDIKNQKQRRANLQQYAEKFSQVKGPYHKAMGVDYMQKKFGDCVQLSTHTWHIHILDQFLETTPRAIEASKQELMRKRKYLSEFEIEKKAKIERAAYLGKKIQELEEFLKSLEQSEENPELQLRVHEKVSAHKREMLNQEKAHLVRHEELLQKKQVQFSQIEARVKIIEEKIAALHEERKKIKTLLLQLTTGDQVLELFRTTYSKEQSYVCRTWKSWEARERALDRLEKREGDFESKTHTIRAEEYEGETAHIAMIEKKYRLVPADLAQRQQFINSLQGGGYVAKVEGLRYVIDLACRSLPDGKKIGYGFRLTWIKGQEIPWIRIVHTIPNQEFNAAEVANQESVVGLIEKDLMGLNGELDGDPGNITGLKVRKQTLESELATMKVRESEIEANIRQMEQEQVLDIRNQTTSEITQLKKEKEKEENFEELDRKITEMRMSISAENANAESLETKLRDLAIIITTQWESAKLLRQFANLVVEAESHLPTKSAAFRSCEDFIQIFDKHQNSVLDQIKTAYGFS